MDWLIPPGRYPATLTDVVSDSKKPGQFRLIFRIPNHGGLGGDKKAAKTYDPNKPHWLERDLRTWLTEDQMSQYFPKGEAGQAELKALVGERAVLVITNEDKGQKNPLVCITEILPCKKQFLAGTATVPAGRKFRFSFAAAA